MSNDTQPPPTAAGAKSVPKSYLDLIRDCDSFPYYHSHPQAYSNLVNSYFTLKVPEYPDTKLGWVLPFVVDHLRDFKDWKVNDEDRTLTLLAGSSESERSAVVAATGEAMRQSGQFQILKGWRNELYPIYGPKRELLFNMERAASALFGVLTYGCHMTAYTRATGKEMMIWVARRSITKQTYAGMLDNTVAGGIATGEQPFASMIRESAEEASLPEDLVRNNAKAVGTVTYLHIRDHRAGGETGLLQPECQYVYDLELAEDVELKPSDNEVQGFELISVEGVKAALRNGQFKPNCAQVLLDFFVRHGIITADDEGYIEIVARLHRLLEFPSI